jgi:hypothetical protein
MIMQQRISKMKWKFKFIVAALLFSSCYRNHLYVQQEWVDRNFLASSHVNTPDPRQSEPPEGQRLLIAWDFPRSIFLKDLSFAVTVRFWDDTQQEIVDPIQRKRGYQAFYFPKKKILTYRVQVVTKEKEVIETWNHQFWTERIDIGDL